VLVVGETISVNELISIRRTAQKHLMKSYLLFTVFIFSLSFSSGASQMTISSDSLLVRQIDSIIKKSKYKKVITNKISGQSQREIFWTAKHDKETFVVAVSESSIVKTLTRYYFIKGVLVKVLYENSKPDHTKGGGVYCFSGDKLIYKREMGIESQNENNFLANSYDLKSKMAVYVQR
jgi:hypothetical protein